MIDFKLTHCEGVYFLELLLRYTGGVYFRFETLEDATAFIRTLSKSQEILEIPA
jgi:hypothetical protein